MVHGSGARAELPGRGRRVAERDWLAWHAAYDRESSLRRRLDVVQRLLAEALDRQPPGRIRIVSLCAGQGRSVVPVVAAHPRRHEVAAQLVELDPRNVALAEAAVESAGLDDVEVVLGDAALTASYTGAVPAQVVLVCGVFGNVTAADIERTVEHLPMLCAPGATVLWTRGRTAPT